MIYKKFYILILLLLLTAPGCYTVIWSPEDEALTENTEDEGYYGESYFGDYNYYYDYPWWIGILYPSFTNTNDYQQERSGNITHIRNSADGRGNNDSNRDILLPDNPTRNVNYGNTNNSSDSNNRDKPNMNDSGNNNTNQNTSTSRSDNNNNSGIRNNDGSRNNDSRRK
jgi:hypothetical protein